MSNNPIKYSITGRGSSWVKRPCSDEADELSPYMCAERLACDRSRRKGSDKVHPTSGSGVVKSLTKGRPRYK